ncbi:MAG: sigma 54-interacting transcriptional regulator [Verrucomicrobiales bacterium]|nr:sigma 54-interacting transcriptional regulator [Verrucomicrobiales bacterium]
MNMDALQDIVLAMAEQRSVASVLQLVVEQIADVRRREAERDSEGGADVALVRLWLVRPGDICHTCRFRTECPDQTRCLHLAASAGRPHSSTEDWSRLDGDFRRFPIGVRKVGHIAATGQPVLVTQMAENTQWVVRPEWVRAEGMHTFAGLPLVFRGETLGVLGLFSRTPLDTRDFEKLGRFANHAAVAIANARAFEEIEHLKSRLEQENGYLRQEVTEALGVKDMIGSSPGLRKVMEQIQLVAATDAAVLITGESGTGKELVARAIHDGSSRHGRALIKVNCGAIPEALFESEFFGHVRGSFTGAIKDKPGRFELADGGTLFLDEIGEVPLSMQSKLLRVLQEQEIERVGDTRTRKLNVRIIAATNRDLKKEAEAGRFRQDLYYRLSVFPIEIPSLRERREDIAPIATHFVKLAARRLNRPLPRITPATLNQLTAQDWPGNVRELQNAVERAVILSRGGPLEFNLSPPTRLPSSSSSEVVTPGSRPLTREEWKRQERENIRAALEQAQGKVFGPGGAAELLGMKPTTLNSRIKALGLRRNTTPDKLPY